MKFFIEQAAEAAKVRFYQDDKDVNIRVNETLVAYFSGASGSISLIHITATDREKLQSYGVQFEGDMIKIDRS